MGESPTEYFQYEAKVHELDPTRTGCRSQIVDLRRELDAACDQSKITLREWRILRELVSSKQAACK